MCTSVESMDYVLDYLHLHAVGNEEGCEVPRTLDADVKKPVAD